MENIISTMLQSYIAMGIVSVLWVVVGFSIAFGDSIGSEGFGLFGNPLTYFMFRGVGGGTHPNLAPTFPFAVFAMFQLKFAIITPALITGSFAGRVHFRAYMLFMCLFIVFIYAPLAHWTWHPNGFLRNWGVLDFAGGTVVHMSAGFAAPAGAIFLGRRKDANKEFKPANIPYILLGAGMILTAVFANEVGLIHGETNTFLYHLPALVIVGIFTFGGSILLYKITDLIVPMRISPHGEKIGLDISQHEESYNFVYSDEKRPLFILSELVV
ncbi:MAG: ammonium transporter [Draconibacterium sp.]